MKKTIITIGAGLAGLSAALAAARLGHEVYVVSAQPSEQAQSVMAEGGINGALNTMGEGDSPAEHYADTLRAGCDLADPNGVWAMTQAAPAIIAELARLGVPFHRIGSTYDMALRPFGGQQKKRTAFVESSTGKHIMTALIDAVRAYETRGHIHRLSHHRFVTLSVSGGRCCGCVIADTYTGHTTTLAGDAVIMATGGMHGLFSHTTGSLTNTGAAVAELFRLGLPIANGEFIQYHPTTLRANGKHMLISEAARGEGGRLYALRGGVPYYFMEEKYPVLGNLMTRDITTREIAAMTAAYGAVYLDLRHVPRDILEGRLASLVDDCLTYGGTDIRTTPIRVEPAIHYFMGGLAVDACHRTAMANLYGAGECCAQYHGANRLGGNSLLGAIYGGLTAARTACAEADGTMYSGTATHDAIPPMSHAEGQAVQTTLSQALGISRTAEVMEEGLAALAPWHGAVSLLARGLLLSALARRESRGAHYRLDYPHRDDAYQKTTVAAYDGTAIHIDFMPIPPKK